MEQRFRSRARVIQQALKQLFKIAIRVRPERSAVNACVKHWVICPSAADTSKSHDKLRPLPGNCNEPHCTRRATPVQAIDWRLLGQVNQHTMTKYGPPAVLGEELTASTQLV